MQQSKPDKLKNIANYSADSTLSVFIYLVISLILLSVLNLRGLWDVFVSPAAGPISSQDISPITNAFNSMQTKLGTPFVYLFWVFVGCVTYSVVLGLQNAVVVSEKEVKESRYLQADEPHKKSYWQSAMTTNLLLLTSAISAGIYAILYFRFLLPGFSRLFYRGLYDPSHYHGLIDVLGAALAGALAMYVFVLLCRVLRYHWHTIRPI